MCMISLPATSVKHLRWPNKLLKRPIEWFKDSRPFDNSTKNDATTQKIYHFVNTTSSRVTEYVQSLNQSHPYSISYLGKY